MAVTFLLAGLLAAPVTPVNQPAPEPPRRLVFASMYALDWSILSGTPSGQVSLFLGSSLRPLTGRLWKTWKNALGYELSVSAGGADRATSFYSWGGDYGIVYHRHHLAGLGYGGPNDRLYYQFGGGVLLWRSTPVALEADIRLGVVLGTKRPGRVKGVVGGQSRIVGVLGGVPILHVGLFAGFFVW